MEAKLKALKVAELKEILTKSSTPIPTKANKADLIAKILATPDALKLAGGGEAAAPAPAPAPAAAAAAEPVAPAAPAPAAEAAAKPVDDDLLAPPENDEFDWEGTGAKPDTGASAEAKPAEPASTTESTPAPTKEDASKSTQEETKSADGDAKPAEGGAPKGVDEELERRKARAARFGIPLVENPVSTKGAGGAGGRGRKGKKGAEEKEKPPAGGAKPEEKKEVAKKPEEKKEKKEEKPKAVKISAKEAAPNDDDAKLAARAARFGISTAPKAAAGGSADPAEDEKRKKREARFGAPHSARHRKKPRRMHRVGVGGALTKERMTDLTTTSASMSHTPARGIPTPRLSSIPTPGSRPGTAQSGIPGRPRSSTGTNTTMAPRDSEAMSMALQDAIKAHDPTRYANNELSPQLPSATVSISGRRSVAGSHRPPSVASTSSSRAKTPVSATSATRPRASLPSRPESRQSNIGRSLSRAGHEFEVGDAVKIESLGMEGTLRFMGEIDGKNGLWAGVELAPAFAGKGKNDGSVAGVRYFTCAPKCGVFTLPNKLSAPLGRSIPRPSSAASHYTNGRTTPSVSGRTTPSFAPVKTIPAPVKKKTEDTTITAGSRASKYVGVTATDLNSRNTASPTRAASTPLGTPKAGRTLPTPRTRPSLAQPGNSTPKAARPYNPMPPPPVPTDSPRKMRQNTITPTSLNSAGADDDRQSLMSALDANNQAIQDKIALLMAGTRTGSNPASPVMRTDDERVAQLEKEIEQLRAEVRDKTASIAEEAAVLNAAIERAVALEEDKRLALERVAELEGANSSVDDVHKAKQEAETRLSEVEAKLKDTESRLTELETQRQAADAKLAEAEEKAKEAETKRSEAESALETLKSSHESELKDKTERVAALETQVSTLETDLQFERRELGQQVDELRFAGQETIALYEERISGMEGRRYELEDLVADLESQIEALKKNGSVPRPGGTTAAEIDNESLREQVSHLQRRLGTLEDQLEDARAQAEREDESARSRIAKAKEGEQAAWKECLELRKEVDNLKRDEGLAKAKIEELVEALREGAVTLEAARGDVEGLRAEVADLESLKTPGTQEGDGQPVEVVQLKRELEDIKKALEVARKNEADLRATLEGLEKDKAEAWQLEQRAAEHQKTVSELQKKGTSAEQLRAESPNTRRDSVDSDSSRGPGKREQIAGLKHIITGLEEEIRQWGSKYAMLEQENKLLESGTEQLQVAMRRLEATIDDKLDTKAEGTDGERIKRIETENELMKTKITEMEQKHARVVLDLNKEITELENLVESKIYREDDLERELERYKEKLARAQRPSGESMLTNGTSKSKSNIKVVTTMADRCELCESKDHDGMDCPLLHDGGEDEPTVKISAAIGKDKKGWCADCEEFGHEVDECPNSQEVF
ncbi:hypothetical protein RHS03_05195, partial [Rhizoctonia solani]